MNFINLPNGKTFAWIPRAGSTAIIRAIVNTFFPERLTQRICLPDGETLDPHSLLGASVSLQKDNEIVVLLRDPVERFRSACAQTGKTVEQGLASLATDPHFAPLLKWSPKGYSGAKAFKFETEFDACTTYLGIGILTPENVSENKPTLTPAEAIAVRSAYAEDLAFIAKVFPAPAPGLGYADLRRNAYLAAGITTDAITIALREKLGEGRPEAFDNLQSQVTAIKALYPKS